MGPVLKEIKKCFDDYISGCSAICDRDPFFRHFWMYHYLFPEVLMVFDDWDTTDSYPCKVCSEEQVLRIMAEHGLL